MLDKLTIGVLLFGDYPQLAERCLQSIFRVFPAEFCREHLRIGANAISPRTEEVIRESLRKGRLSENLLFVEKENICKYPIMRKMSGTVATEYFCWFDDDSYLQPWASPTWPARLEKVMARTDMVGKVYTIPWQGSQRQWVKQQPWYGGKDPARQPRVTFVTGGWWTVRTEIHKRWDYPFPSLHHRGGDTMLGELFRQQSRTFLNWYEDVAINQEKRRGHDESPLGFVIPK